MCTLVVVHSDAVNVGGRWLNVHTGGEIADAEFMLPWILRTPQRKQEILGCRGGALQCVWTEPYLSQIVPKQIKPTAPPLHRVWQMRDFVLPVAGDHILGVRGRVFCTKRGMLLVE